MSATRGCSQTGWPGTGNIDVVEVKEQIICNQLTDAGAICNYNTLLIIHSFLVHNSRIIMNTLRSRIIESIYEEAVLLVPTQSQSVPR